MQNIQLKNLKMVSETEVAEFSIPLNELWLVNHKNDLFGPFNQIELQECIFANPEVYQETQVCNLEDSQWMPVFKNKIFQRRKPQLIATQELEFDQVEFAKNDNIYVIKHGQKSGPFKLELIHNMIDKKELLMTDLLSIDMGKSWQKIYQNPVLNRREVLTSDQLPTSHIKFNTSKDLQVIDDQIGHDVAGLAYIQKLSSHTAVEIDISQFGKEKKQTLAKLKNKTTISAIAASACVIVILAVTLSGGKKNKRMIASEENEKSSVVQAEKKSPQVNKSSFKASNNIRKNNAEAIRNIQNKRNAIVVNKNFINSKTPRAKRNVSPIRGAHHNGLRPNNSHNIAQDNIGNYVDNNDERLKDPREEFEKNNKKGRSIAQDNPYQDERDMAQDAIDQVDHELKTDQADTELEYREQNDF
jgi:hypothetical protein